MDLLDDFLRNAAKYIQLSLPKNKALIRDRKISDLADRVGAKNLKVLLNLPRTERMDILKRLKKMKEIR